MRHIQSNRFFHRSLIVMCIFIVLFPIVAAADNDNLSYPESEVRNMLNTMEKCSNTNRTCRKDLKCMSFNFDSVPPKECTDSSADNCYCYPTTVTYCTGQENENRCPRGETCAQSIGGNLFCVGCSALTDLSYRYKATVTKACKDKSRNPAPYVPGLTNDLCSIVDTCANGLTCIDSESRSSCERFSTRCHCAPRGTNPKECESSKECIDGEVCASDTISGGRYCVSCDDALFYRQYSIGDDSTCGEKGQNKRREIPYYPETPDGYILDTCVDQLQCRVGLECREYLQKQPCSTNSFLCVCQKKDNSFTSCKKTNNCSKGEVCASGKDTPLDKDPKCVSHIYDKENLPNDVIVKQPRKYGMKVIGDACRGELDCVEELACTHPSDNFGWCAGRRLCTCQPIKIQGCNSKKDCRDKEDCVNLHGAKGKNYCKSKAAIDPNLERRFDKNDKKPPKSESNRGAGQTCTSSADCTSTEQFPRKCFHISERFDECNNDRAGCICKAAKPGKNSIWMSDENASCKKNNKCGNDEVCVQYIDTISNNGFCLATAIAKNDTNTFEIL